VKDLTSLGLDADVHEVPSDKPSDTVTAQDPRPGTIVVEGASVRVNVSSGPKPVAVPAVIGQTYETAAAQLQAAGFTVGRADVESDQPAGQVVDQDPPGNSTASRGSSVTLSVSQGPKTATVPDVSLQSVADARATLRAAGFKSSVTEQETEDEALDGLVISQDPAGNAQADPKTVVKLTVGTFVPPPDVTTTTTPAPTPTPTTAQPPPP